MTHPPAASNRHAAVTSSAREALYVVSVRDTVNPVLAGHDGGEYTSPPQPRDQALALVALLLGRRPGEAGAEQTWTASLAGGRRTITIAPAA
jgi:hypothetical protein